jgi:C-terminal processing protease CtpA/Prc
VKYFHPSLAYRTDIDWDSALLAAIPRVRASRTAAQYAAAVGAMLGVVGDPLTRVRVERSETTSEQVLPRVASARLTPDSVLVVYVGEYEQLFGPDVQRAMADAASAIAGARAVLIDLRSAQPADPFWRAQLDPAFAGLQRLLSRDTIETPGSARRVYYGFESESPFASGQYRIGRVMENGKRIAPAGHARDLPVVFLLNEHAVALGVMSPLQRAGRATIVYEGNLQRHTVGDYATIPLSDGFIAEVRTSELVFSDGRSGAFQPDEIVPSRTEAAGATSEIADGALARALERARDFRPSVLRAQRVPASVATIRDRGYSSLTELSAEHRLLGLFRYWNAIAHFYPYKHLLDRDWDAVLFELIPVFGAARDSADYARAVATLAARLTDSHAYVAGAAFREAVIDEGYPPIRVRLIENRPIVAQIFDTAAAKRAGVAIGDEVLQVDGQPARARLALTARYISASTPGNRADRAAEAFMNGPVGSIVSLSIRRADGGIRRVTLPRRREDFNSLFHRERSGPVIDLLPGNVGYVDLDRLTFDMIDSAFTRLARTRGIIFDMRGYPNGTVYAIAPRLTDSTRVVARVETPLVGHRSSGPAVETVLQTVDPAPSEQRYRGMIVMLMDERSVSQAEHTGLFLKAVSNAVLVGSPTAGANGEVTTVQLPGGLSVGFTGQSIRWPDGRELQRKGLIPDVAVRPTIAGLRAGRDEVLDEARRIVMQRAGP